MHWHAQPLRCSRALVLRGYSRGSYAAQSPYSALMLVVTRRLSRQAAGGTLGQLSVVLTAGTGFSVNSSSGSETSSVFWELVRA